MIIIEDVETGKIVECDKESILIEKLDGILKPVKISFKESNCYLKDYKRL
jgi:hypothetical protein